MRRNVALIGAICIIIGWLLASTLTPPVAQVQTLPSAPAPRSTVQPVPAATVQMDFQRQQPRPTPVNRRNPFVFATRPRAVTPTSPQSETLSPDAADSAPVPSGPAYVLAGIGISGTERTAILATDGAVTIARVTDVIGEFTVADITDRSVTLTRGDKQFVLRLAH